MADLFPGPDTQLVLWEKCFIRPSLLERIRAAVMKLDDPDQQEDIRATLAEKLAGKQVLTVQDLPANIIRVLNL